MSKFKRFIGALVLVIGTLVPIGTFLGPLAPVVSAQDWKKDEASFNEVYWSAQPPSVRVLRQLREPVLSQTAKELADKGFLIDHAIMVWQWSPYLVMWAREVEGLTWVPNANQEPLNLAGDALKYGFGGRTYDPKNPPPGSIRVSRNVADYPPFDPPVVVPPPGPDKPPVGDWVGFANRFYSNESGKRFKDGEKVTQDGVQYTKRVVNNVMGVFHFWEK